MAPECMAVLIRGSRSQGRGVTPEGRRFEAQVPDPRRRSRILPEVSSHRQGRFAGRLGGLSQRQTSLSAELAGGRDARQQVTAATREQSRRGVSVFSLQTTAATGAAPFPRDRHSPAGGSTRGSLLPWTNTSSGGNASVERSTAAPLMWRAIRGGGPSPSGSRGRRSRAAARMPSPLGPRAGASPAERASRRHTSDTLSMSNQVYGRATAPSDDHVLRPKAKVSSREARHRTARSMAGISLTMEVLYQLS
jgi:hypothetical protein